jgi:hypothetical protein
MLMFEKWLGLFFILMAVAACTATSASATELCSTETTTCSGTKYGTGTVFKAPLASGSGFFIENSISRITCTSATLEGKTTSAGGSSAVAAEITNFLPGSCKLGTGTTCSAWATLNLPWPAEFTGSIISGPFYLRLADSAGVALYFSCHPFIDCTFSTTLAVLQGGPEVPGAPRFLADTTMSRSGSLCPSTARLTTVWQISQPVPLYVV